MSTPDCHWTLLRQQATVAVALALALPSSSAIAQLLQSLQRGALASDPAVFSAEAQVRSAEERLYQSRAAMGPVATLALNRSESRYRELPERDLREFRGKQATLQINQPLVRAAQMHAADSAQAQLEQAQAQSAQVRSDATVKLLEAAFDLLKARDALELTSAQLLAAQEQLASARRSFEVGRSSIIDVREAEAKIDTVAAQADSARTELALRREIVSELVGRDVPELLDRGLLGDRLPDVKPGSIQSWIGDALAQSLQISAAQRALDSAQFEVEKAWQGHAPTADLSYTFTRNSDTGTVTSIFPRRGDSGQVALAVNIPLFAGGATQSKVREALAIRDKAQGDLDTVRRNVQLTVRQAFAATLSSAGLSRGLETATRSLEAAMKANQRGYEVGMKVNAEVLESQSKWFESRRDLSKARYDAWLSYTRLRAAAGILGDADVALLDGLLVPVPSATMRGRVPERIRDPDAASRRAP